MIRKIINYFRRRNALLDRQIKIQELQEKALAASVALCQRSATELAVNTVRFNIEQIYLDTIVEMLAVDFGRNGNQQLAIADLRMKKEKAVSFQMSILDAIAKSNLPKNNEVKK